MAEKKLEEIIEELYGLAGTIKIAGKEIAFMSDFDIDQSLETKDGTYFKIGKRKRAGAIEWSFSANGKADFGTDTKQTALLEAFNAKKPVEIELYLNDKRYFKGKALLNKCKITNSAEGEYNLEISGDGNSALELKEVGVGG